MARSTSSATDDRTIDPSLCTCANLRMATRSVTQAFDEALAPAGIKATQFTLMATLNRLDEVPLTQLAERLVMDRTTLTRNLKPLIDRGLIEAERSADRRVRKLRLSREGARVLNKAMPLWQKVQKRVVAGLGPERWQTLLDDLAIAVSVTRQE